MTMRNIFQIKKKPLRVTNISPHWDCYAIMYILLKQILFFRQLVNMGLGFPGGSVVKNLPANAEDLQDE